MEITLGILTFRNAGVAPWNPNSLKHGIYGSEECVICMSQTLPRLGYRVLVYVDWEENSPFSQPMANPRFVGTNATEWTPLDIAISWRVPYGAKWLKDHAKKVYLWPHDEFPPLLTDDEIDGFDDVLWVSHWQREQWASKYPRFAKFSHVFGNGIDPEQFPPIQEKSNPHSCIYGSNYARGLEILLDLWPKVKEKYPKATLDIYYGWQHFGLLPPEKVGKMKSQITALADQSVHEHGQVGQEELNQAYARCSLWTYPCTGYENFCMSALRAQFSGAIPVIIEGSALKETVRHGFKCAKKEDYYHLLLEAMDKADKITLQERLNMRSFILQEYTWDIMAQRWHQLFKEHL